MASGWFKVLLLASAVAAYQVLAYFLTVRYPGHALGEMLMAAPLAALAGGVLWRTARGRIVLALLVAAGALALAGRPEAGALLYPVPYVTVHLVLLWFFGRTLRPGRVPLVTQLALRVHGELPAQITAYTRRVTQAWCAFFAAMAATLLLLYALAPLPVWSAFNNLLNFPLAIAMYLGEYAWRRWRYPDFSHASIATVVRACRDFDFNPPAAER
ncbi:MAG TPA: hypothetical protein VFV71_10685 [Burkholderiales bacterium]|nr:hypothetical protein [Burkholderiales bacterium]